MVFNYEYSKSVENGQDIFDIALQEYGDVNAVFLLFEDNQSLDLVRLLGVGEKLKFRINIPEVVIANRKKMAFYRNNKLRVNNGEYSLLKTGCSLKLSLGGSIKLSSGQYLFISCHKVAQVLEPVVGLLLGKNSLLYLSNGQLLIPTPEPVLFLSNLKPFQFSNGQNLKIEYKLPVLILSNGQYLEVSKYQALILK